MSNSNKPLKFARLPKLTNQSMLNSARLIEMTETSTVTFMKERKSLAVLFREKRVNWVKNRGCEDIFLKFLLIVFG